MRLKQRFLEMLTTVGGSIDTTHPIVSYCILSYVILFHYNPFLMLNLCFKYRNYFLHITNKNSLFPYHSVPESIFFVTLSRSVRSSLEYLIGSSLSITSVLQCGLELFWLFWIVATATVPAHCEQLQLDISAQGFLRGHGWLPSINPTSSSHPQSQLEKNHLK